MDKFQVAIHAIGDAANAEALAAIADLTADLATDVPGERRWRLEHAQIIDPADIARFAALQVIASLQPVHQPHDPGMAPARPGPDTTPRASTCPTAQHAGVSPALGPPR